MSCSRWLRTEAGGDRKTTALVVSADTVCLVAVVLCAILWSACPQTIRGETWANPPVTMYPHIP